MKTMSTPFTVYRLASDYVGAHWPTVNPVAGGVR